MKCWPIWSLSAKAHPARSWLTLQPISEAIKRDFLVPWLQHWRLYFLRSWSSCCNSVTENSVEEQICSSDFAWSETLCDRHCIGYWYLYGFGKLLGSIFCNQGQYASNHYYCVSVCCNIWIQEFCKKEIVSYHFDHTICNSRCGSLRNISLCAAVICHNISLWNTKGDTWLCENQVSPFFVALLYGSYPMPVMFSYCLIGNSLKACFLSYIQQHQRREYRRKRHPLT